MLKVGPLLYVANAADAPAVAAIGPAAAALADAHAAALYIYI